MTTMIPVRDNVQLCVTEYGDPANPLSIHIEGHMAQSVDIPTQYCQLLADNGLFVVCFDNRDIGRSTRTDWPYTMTDMAEDVYGLIQHYGQPALVTGRSMGGCIAQLLALAHRDAVRGLGLFFTFARDDDEPLSTALPTTPAPFCDKDSYLSWQQTSLPPLAGDAYPWTGESVDRLARLHWQRGVSWDGYMRQRRAMRATPGWASQLATLDVPTVIFHGDQDPVIDSREGHKIHRLIPHSTLHIITGMGHQQPATLSQFFATHTRSLLS